MLFSWQLRVLGRVGYESQTKQKLLSTWQKIGMEINWIVILQSNRRERRANSVPLCMWFNANKKLTSICTALLCQECQYHVLNLWQLVVSSRQELRDHIVLSIAKNFSSHTLSSSWRRKITAHLSVIWAGH